MLSISNEEMEPVLLLVQRKWWEGGKAECTFRSSQGLYGDSDYVYLVNECLMNFEKETKIGHFIPNFMVSRLSILA